MSRSIIMGVLWGSATSAVLLSLFSVVAPPPPEHDRFAALIPTRPHAMPAESDAQPTEAVAGTEMDRAPTVPPSDGVADVSADRKAAPTGAATVAAISDAGIETTIADRTVTPAEPGVEPVAEVPGTRAVLREANQGIVAPGAATATDRVVSQTVDGAGSSAEDVQATATVDVAAGPTSGEVTRAVGAGDDLEETARSVDAETGIAQPATLPAEAATARGATPETQVALAQIAALRPEAVTEATGSVSATVTDAAPRVSEAQTAAAETAPEEAQGVALAAIDPAQIVGESAATSDRENAQSASITDRATALSDSVLGGLAAPVTDEAQAALRLAAAEPPNSDAGSSLRLAWPELSGVAVGTAPKAEPFAARLAGVVTAAPGAQAAISTDVLARTGAVSAEDVVLAPVAAAEPIGTVWHAATDREVTARLFTSEDRLLPARARAASGSSAQVPVLRGTVIPTPPGVEAQRSGDLVLAQATDGITQETTEEPASESPTPGAEAPSTEAPASDVAPEDTPTERAPTATGLGARVVPLTERAGGSTIRINRPTIAADPAPETEVAADPPTSDTPAPAAPGMAMPAPPAPSLGGSGRRLIIGSGEDAPIANETPIEAAQDANATALERNARAFDRPEDGRPLLAVVLLETRADADMADALSELGFPVTFAIPPDRPNAAAVAERYAGLGQEILLAGAGLPQGATPQDVEVSLTTYFSDIPSAIGLMATEDSGFVGDRDLIDQVLQVLAEDGHGLVLWDNGLNPAVAAAERAGRPTALIYRRIDSRGANGAEIGRRLDRAVFEARRDGAILVVGEARPETVSALRDWSASNRAREIAFAPASALLLGQ
ncbi:MAG: divergent polysaccharide deacetylase family protein [Pseudomonadota bacterium]